MPGGTKVQVCALRQLAQGRSWHDKCLAVPESIPLHYTYIVFWWYCMCVYCRFVCVKRRLIDWCPLVFQHVLAPWPSFLTFAGSSKGFHCTTMLLFFSFCNAIHRIAMLNMRAPLCVTQSTHRALLLKISFRTRTKRQERSCDGSGVGVWGSQSGGWGLNVERERERQGGRTRDSEPEHLLDHLCFKTFNHCLWLRTHATACTHTSP